MDHPGPRSQKHPTGFTPVKEAAGRPVLHRFERKAHLAVQLKALPPIQRLDPHFGDGPEYDGIVAEGGQHQRV